MYTAAQQIMTQDRHASEREPDTLIVGLGKTGLSCARYCLLHGVKYAVVDSREQPPCQQQLHQLDAKAEIYTGGFDTALLEDVERLLVSPGVSLHSAFIQQARERGIEIIGDIELFARHATAPVVAITGSNGKSTVTTLVGEMAKRAGKFVKVGGNLGTPAIDLLLEQLTDDHADKSVDFYVLELSSFQLEATTSLNALAAVVLNVSPDHMDRYASYAEYIAAKQFVYHGDGVMIVNRDDPYVMEMLQSELRLNPGRKVLSFGLSQPVTEAGDVATHEFGIVLRDGLEYLAQGNTLLLPVSELKITGKHNQANALAALALGQAMQLSMPAMLETLRTFAGLPHRMQWVANCNQVNWYNDSKGTNLGATISAITGMPGDKILIAGGDGKGADFTPLRDVVLDNQIRAVVLIGVDADKIAAALGDSVTIVYADSMQDAVEKSNGLAQAGDSVLLSPACASFDMFKNYEHRGDVFMQAVQAVAARQSS